MSFSKNRMNIAKVLIGRASCVLAVLAVGLGAGVACGQTDGAKAASVTFTTLHSFDYKDGARPTTGLVQATNGDLYAPTRGGGPNHAGTIFKITPGGTLTTLYNFCALGNPCEDGESPLAGLVQAANGDLYGTTSFDGAHGHGTVFNITLGGTLTTLYSFCSISNCTDGAGGTYGALVHGTNGDFYGTTLGGGANGFFGTVFKITPTGTLTTLYSFCSQTGYTDGDNPTAGLIQATDGDFYGTTYLGGVPNSSCQFGTCGTVFKITPGGALTTLHSFDSSDGANPLGVLVQDTDGTFYGTTAWGGANGYGTVFSLSVGLGAFVEIRPGVGIAGTAVKILGSDLTGTTSVTFNGTPATILYDAPTVIYARVPTGATTGKVQVVTPKGTLTSNVAFEVAP
jgi:uncharacterized repeat protein (TIGR03803 family)